MPVLALAPIVPTTDTSADTSTVAVLALDTDQPSAPIVTLNMGYELVDALVNVLTKNSTDLPTVLADLLAPLRTMADDALDTMVEDAFGPQIGLHLVA